jgi:hypothetical protein
MTLILSEIIFLSYIAQLQNLSVAYNVVVQSTLMFRQCVDGEILIVNQCLECPSGGFSFNYNPLQPVTQCTTCPENSYDCYGSTILVSPGYWRINQYAVTIVKCNYGTAACIGGDGMGVTNSSRRLQGVAFTSANEYVGICAKGYEGPLCGVCSAHYFFSSSFKTCNTCDGQGAQQLATMILVPLVLLLVIVFFFFYTFTFSTDVLNGISKGDDEIKKDSANIEKVENKLDMKALAIFMMPKVKIMLTVYQIISNLPFALNIQYPAAAAKLFSIFR